MIHLTWFISYETAQLTHVDNSNNSRHSNYQDFIFWQNLQCWWYENFYLIDKTVNFSTVMAIELMRLNTQFTCIWFSLKNVDPFQERNVKTWWHLAMLVTNKSQIMSWHCHNIFTRRLSRIFGPIIRLGWFTAYIANVFLTKLQGPISPRKSRDHIKPKQQFKAGFKRYQHSPFSKMPNGISFIWIFLFFRFFMIFSYLRNAKNAILERP